MLKLAAYINITIAIAHIVGLFWAEEMFEATGIAEEMAFAAQNIHHIYPYFITIVVAIFFFVFGIYALSADGKIRKLPFTKPIIFLIAGVYLLRGFGELIYDIKIQQANQMLETSYSLVAVLIGLLFLIGGIRKWKLITKNK